MGRPAHTLLWLLLLLASPAALHSTLYPGCANVSADWLPECWIAAHARIQIGGDRYLYWTPHTSNRWGNVLSPYWQARALALLAGHGFDAYVGFERDWLKHLPKRVAPSGCPRFKDFDTACNQCDAESWAYAHRCAGAWTWIRPTIMNDTQHAFAAWAAETKFKLPQFSPGDVVIQSRCSTDTVLQHPEYGPVAFSFFKHISSDTKNIRIVTNLRDRAPLCAAIHKAQLKWLRAQYPGANVTIQGDTMHKDFASLLLAPVLFKDAQSSFGLWAAVANTGEVWSVPLLSTFTNTTKPDLGVKWHWADAPVLYPHVAEAAGIKVEDAAAIIKWLESH